MRLGSRDDVLLFSMPYSMQYIPIDTDTSVVESWEKFVLYCIFKRKVWSTEEKNAFGLKKRVAFPTTTNMEGVAQRQMLAYCTTLLL